MEGSGGFKVQGSRFKKNIFPAKDLMLTPKLCGLRA
jgi:hypothetical protein